MKLSKKEKYDILVGWGYYHKDGDVYNINRRFRVESKNTSGGYISVPAKTSYNDLGIRITITTAEFIWFANGMEEVKFLIHKDGDVLNDKIDNLAVKPLPAYLLPKIPKVRKPREKKPKPKPVPKISTVTKKYVKNDELVYEIIVSKGKGKLTLNASKILFKLGENCIRRFTYFNEDDKYDCMMTGILTMLENWQNFNELKYENAFAYFTEIFKRGTVKGLKNVHGANYSGTPNMMSINNMIEII